MANVNITTPLRAMIKRNICKPFDEQYRLACTLSLEDSLMLYEKIFVSAEQAALLDQLPSAWTAISKSEHFKQKIYVGHQPNDGDKVKKHWLQFTLPTDERYYSYAWTYSNSSDTSSTETIHHNWMTVDLRDQGLSKDYIATLEQIVADRNQTVTTVEKMLDGCSTLNQVAKIWPAITKYVDADVIERMNKKSVRKTAANLNLDPEAMQKLSVHHIRQQMTS